MLPLGGSFHIHVSGAIMGGSCSEYWNRSAILLCFDAFFALYAHARHVVLHYAVDL